MLVQVINSLEQKMRKRLGRHGYDEEECARLLKDSRKTGAIIIKRRSFLRNSLKDLTEIKSC